MTKKSLFVLFLLTTAFVLKTKASNNDSLVNRIFVLIYEQNLNEAEQLFLQNKNQINEFYQTFLNLDIHWWKYRTQTTSENSHALNELIDASELPETKNYEQKMRQIIVKSYELRYAKKQFNIFRLLSARSEIRELIGAIEKAAPPFTGYQQKLFESYVIMYRYIENINFFANARKSEARQRILIQMEKFANEPNVVLNTVAHFFLARMYQQIEDEPQKALIHFRILTQRYPTNKTFAEYQQECIEDLE